MGFIPNLLNYETPDGVLIVVVSFGWLLQIIKLHILFMGSIADHKDLSGLPIRFDDWEPA